MRGKWKSGIRIFAGAVLAAAVLAGCSSKTAESGAAQDAGQNTAQGNSDSQEVRKVYVAVGATFEPYTYIDENNQPAGYDVAVLQEIDNRLPQYEFQIENMELASSLRRTRKERRSICLQMKVLPLTISVLYTKKEEMISSLLMIWLERK